jgi:hypothetical protein
MNKTVIIFATVLMFCSVALARESAQIVGARYLGMGSCFVTAVNDRTMLFANPAALDRAETRMLTIMGFAATANSKTADVIGFGLDNRDKFEDLGDMPEEEQDEFFDQIIDEINYKRMNVMVSTLPFGWIQRPFGGVIFTDTRISAMAYNGASNTPLVDLLGTQDLGGIVGFAHGWMGLQSFLPNRLSVGADLKYVRRYAYSMRETMTELADADSPELMSGNTIGLDLGLLYDINAKTRLGLAVYDVLASDIEWDGDSSDVSRIQPGDKQDIQPALRIGFTRLFAPEAGFLASPILLAFDLAEPFDGEVTFFKKIHVGAEASLFRTWLKARLGLSQGYPSAGLGIGVFSYAYYAEETGRHAGQIADHRHVISLGLWD